MIWSIQTLGQDHLIDGFSCGEPALDDYLKKHAWQSNATGLGRTFVALTSNKLDVCGYFTLAAGAVRFDHIADHQKQRLPRYPIPTVHLAKLAVHKAHQKKGLGAALLIGALQRAARAGDQIGVFAVDVIALNERAKSFYLKYDFVPLLDNPLHLYMGIRKVKAVAAIAEKR